VPDELDVMKPDIFIKRAAEMILNRLKIDEVLFQHSRVQAVKELNDLVLCTTDLK
jgi:hypothetical protein